MTHPPDLSPAVPPAVLTPESVEEIASCLADLRGRMDQAATATRNYLAKRHEHFKYDVLELGWLLLKLRKIHLAETVSGRRGEDGRLQAREGFYAQVRVLWGGELNHRTASNYMNVPRHAGLTAESTRTEVAVVRSCEGLKGKQLQALYRPLPDEPDPLDDGSAPDPAAELELEAEEQAQWWRNLASEVEQRGLEKKTWATARLSPKERVALAEVFSEFARELRGAVKSGVPALPEA